MLEYKQIIIASWNEFGKVLTFIRLMKFRFSDHWSEKFGRGDRRNPIEATDSQ